MSIFTSSIVRNYRLDGMLSIELKLNQTELAFFSSTRPAVKQGQLEEYLHQALILGEEAWLHRQNCLKAQKVKSNYSL